MEEMLLSKLVEAGTINAYRYFQSIGSTNTEALAWADEGAMDGSLVVADEQTRGRGRFDRRWITRPGSSLAFSLILHPSQEEIARLPLFAPLCGLAVRDAIASILNLDARIKWPNDVLLERKKCCGILVEAAWQGAALNSIILGIGINISEGSLPPPEQQQFSATTLEIAAQTKVDRFEILKQVLLEIQKWRPLLGTPTFFDQWTANLAFIGEQVMIVQSEKQSIIGIEKGIDSQGNLVLILENHEEQAFEVGDVHLRPLGSSFEPGGQYA